MSSRHPFCGVSQVLRHDRAHRLGGLYLQGVHRVRVGAQREARIGVSEHPRHRADVHTVLERHRRERVSECVETNVLQPRRFEHPRMQAGDRVRIVHPARHRRGEHVRVVGVLFMLRYEQVDRLLRDGLDADRGRRFRCCDLDAAALSANRLLGC